MRRRPFAVQWTSRGGVSVPARCPALIDSSTMRCHGVSRVGADGRSAGDMRSGFGHLAVAASSIPPRLRDAYGSPGQRPPRADFHLPMSADRGRRTSRRRGLPSTSSDFRPRARRPAACAVQGSRLPEAASTGSSPTRRHGRIRDRLRPRSRPVALPKAHARQPLCPAGAVSTPCPTLVFPL